MFKSPIFELRSVLVLAAIVEDLGEGDAQDLVRLIAKTKKEIVVINSFKQYSKVCNKSSLETLEMERLKLHMLQKKKNMKLGIWSSL